MTFVTLLRFTVIPAIRDSQPLTLLTTGPASLDSNAHPFHPSLQPQGPPRAVPRLRQIRHIKRNKGSHLPGRRVHPDKDRNRLGDTNLPRQVFKSRREVFNSIRRCCRWRWISGGRDQRRCRSYWVWGDVVCKGPAEV